MISAGSKTVSVDMLKKPSLTADQNEVQQTPMFPPITERRNDVDSSLLSSEMLGHDNSKPATEKKEDLGAMLRVLLS